MAERYGKYTLRDIREKETVSTKHIKKLKTKLIPKQKNEKIDVKKNKKKESDPKSTPVEKTENKTVSENVSGQRSFVLNLPKDVLEALDGIENIEIEY